MSGIIEVVDHGEWQAVALCEPFDGRAGFAGDHVDDCRIGFVMGLAFEIGGKQRWAVINAEHPLKARTGGGNQSRGQCRGAPRHRIALENDDFRSGFVRRQRRAKPRCAGADNDERRTNRKPVGGWSLDAQQRVPSYCFTGCPASEREEFEYSETTRSSCR